MNQHRWVKRVGEHFALKHSRARAKTKWRCTALEHLEDRVTPVAGLTPAQIRVAYGINSIPTFASLLPGGGVPADGTGQAIAIIDPYLDPNIVLDLNSFDQGFSLTTGGPTLFAQYGGATGGPAGTLGPGAFFNVYNQSGINITNLIGSNTSKNVVTVNGVSVPGVDPSGPGSTSAEQSEGEAALDVEWAHAIAPGAKIDLIECNSNSTSDENHSIPPATGLPGVSVVSMSFGGAEYDKETSEDSYFIQPSGVTFIAATGDSGAPGAYPAYSPYVLAVGGTTLNVDNAGNYLSEGAWADGGGGISQYERKPTYQDSVQPARDRAIPDVAFDADPNTGVAFVDSYNNPFNPLGSTGGTSLGAPCWAGLIAIANQGRILNGEAPLNSFNPQQTLQILYGIGNNPAQYAQDFHDITQGSNRPVTTATITNPGVDYPQFPTVSFSGGQNATATLTTSFGQVVGITLKNAGTNYNVNDTVTINGGGSQFIAGGTGAKAQITSVNRQTGAITGLNLTAGGSGYLSVDIPFGGGTGATGVPVVNSQGQITAVNITFSGDQGFTSDPPLKFSGAGGSGASGYGNIAQGSNANPGYDEATGLGTPIANNLIPALVAAPVVVNGIYGLARLGQVSDQAPALATVNNQTYIAWTVRGNPQLSFVKLNPSGSTDANPETTFPNITINGSPALATLNGQMYVAWAGQSPNKGVIFIAQAIIKSTGYITLSNVTNTGQTTGASPALAAFNGSLYLAWAGGKTDLNVLQLNGILVEVAQKYTSGATVHASPALGVSGGQLFVAWDGQTHNHQIFVSTVVTINGNPAVPPPVGLPETSSQTPALADYNGQPVIAWSGSGNHDLNAMLLTVNGGAISADEASKVGSTVAITNAGGIGNTVYGGPALDSATGFLFIAWNGGDLAGDLYVAPLGFGEVPVVIREADAIIHTEPGNPSLLGVYQGSTLLDSYQMGTFDQIQVIAPSAPGSLTLDFSDGNFLPSGGITFDGASAGVLCLEGGAFTNEVIALSSGNLGTVSLDGVPINYTNVYSILDTAPVTNLKVLSDNIPGEIVGFSSDPDGSLNDVPVNMLECLAGGADNLLYFGDKTNVTFQAGSQGGTYSVGITQRTGGLAALAIDGAGSASETFDVYATPPTASVTIATNGAPATVNVCPISQDLDSIEGPLRS